MKALIAMSGGVDSSLAAKLTLDQGIDCIGCTMKLFEAEESACKISRTCCSLEDVEDARSVARRLHMPYYVFNFKDGFQRLVIDRFVSSYCNGMTPNPCIDCNRFMKFDLLMQRARELGCDYLVTGHYARREFDAKAGIFRLKKGLDVKKDQSYVLYSMTQEQLARTLFPLGQLTKDQVREQAECFGFVNADKPDSQDICFVPDGDYASMIERRTGRTFPPGDFLDLDGNVIGTHQGIIRYTVGQRKHLGMTFGKPQYVCRINASDNSVTLGGPDDVFSSFVRVEEFNWIAGQPPESDIRCKVRLRYQQAEKWATVHPIDGGKSVEITFDEPQRAAAPGQAAVLYDGDEVLGGGTITKK